MDTFDQWQHREYQQQKDYFERLRDEMESQVDQEWEEYHAEELERSQAIASYFMQFDDDGNESLPVSDKIIKLPRKMGYVSKDEIPF
jgi:hypothetical protein